MKPIKHRNTTATLGAPAGWNEAKDGPCAGLPVVIHDRQYYSYWRPTIIDRLKIITGCPIRLCVASGAHPPVSLTATNN